MPCRVDAGRVYLRQPSISNLHWPTLLYQTYNIILKNYRYSAHHFHYSMPWLQQKGSLHEKQFIRYMHLEAVASVALIAANLEVTFFFFPTFQSISSSKSQGSCMVVIEDAITVFGRLPVMDVHILHPTVPAHQTKSYNFSNSKDHQLILSWN